MKQKRTEYLVGHLARLLRRLRQRTDDERGTAAIEMALIMPFLLMLLLGSVELFLLGMAARKAARVTGTVGDLVAQASGTLTKNAINSYYHAAQYILGKFPKSNMGLSIFVYARGPKGQPRVRWSHQLGSVSCTSTAPTLTNEQKMAMQDGNDLVLTLGCYRYPVRIGKLVFGNYTFRLKSEVVLRPRKQMTLACSDC